MKIVDANVLLYAVDPKSRHHDASREWLDRSISGGDVVGLAWNALMAFVRISTKLALLPRPLTIDQAFLIVDIWLAAPGTKLIQPGGGHALILERLLKHAGTGGSLVNDAHLAALAVEQRADIVSYDFDFGRFPDVRWRRPDDLLTESGH